MAVLTTLGRTLTPFAKTRYYRVFERYETERQLKVSVTMTFKKFKKDTFYFSAGQFVTYYAYTITNKKGEVVDSCEEFTYAESSFAVMCRAIIESLAYLCLNESKSPLDLTKRMTAEMEAYVKAKP